jgi:molybdopterin converting factor small subunit
VILDHATPEVRDHKEKENPKPMECYQIDNINWKRSNCKCLMVIKERISTPIWGAIPECETTVEYLEKMESQFTGSSKAYVSTLIKRLTTEKYSRGGVRDHILRISNVVVMLKPLDLAIKDGFLIYLIFNTLSKEFETFEVNYNSMNEKWTLGKCIAMCVQEEERIKRNSGGIDSVNLAKHNNKKRNFVPKPAPRNEENEKGEARPPAEKYQCKWCFKRGHYQKNCIEFLKHLNKTCEDHITFVNEFLFLSYAKSTWWIDLGITIHIANSMQVFIMRRTLRREERSIRVANDVKAEVEAIGEFPLELNNGFILRLHNVLYVPSLSRNLISISCLDDDGFDCQFDNKQCSILFTSKVVGLAF